MKTEKGTPGWEEETGQAKGHDLTNRRRSEWNHAVVGNVIVDFLSESGIKK